MEQTYNILILLVTWNLVLTVFVVALAIRSHHDGGGYLKIENENKCAKKKKSSS